MAELLDRALGLYLHPSRPAAAWGGLGEGTVPILQRIQPFDHVLSQPLPNLKLGTRVSDLWPNLCQRKNWGLKSVKGSSLPSLATAAQPVNVHLRVECTYMDKDELSRRLVHNPDTYPLPLCDTTDRGLRCKSLGDRFECSGGTPQAVGLIPDPS